MKLSKNKIKFFSGLTFLSLIFVCLRLKTLNHLLMWDEAWNILSLRAFLLNAPGNPFYWFYRYHPPLYMAFAGLLSPFKDGFDIRLEFLSLFFSYTTFLVMYLLSARIGGWRYAWLSGLFLCMMPGAIGYDTWIKRDGLASALGYLALLFLLRRRFFWCAVSLAFSLLSKENGAFFALAVFLSLPLLKEKKPLKKIFLLSSVIVILTSWWYIFFSVIKEHGPAFFSKMEYSMLWANTPLYYVKKLLPDLSPAILFFLVVGICHLPLQSFSRKQPRWFLPVMVTMCVYVPISLFFTLKSPWLFLPARPALAMIAAGGALYLFKKSREIKFLSVLFYLPLCLTVLSGLFFSYPDYHMETYPNGWPGARSSRQLALYLNERMTDRDRLMITEFTYWQMPVCPVFMYYWKPHPVKIVKVTEKAIDLIKEIISDRISWLVVVGSPVPQSDFQKLSKDIRNIIQEEPQTVGCSYVWKTESLWSDKNK